MARKSTKAPVSRPQEPVEVSDSDREALIGAFKAGLIMAWKRDAERGYRLTFEGARDEYVEVAKLASYLGKVKAATT
jgi:hypothetical protein